MVGRGLGARGIGKTAKPRDVRLNLSAAYPHTRRYPSILLYPRDARLRMTASQLIYRIKHKVG